MTLQKTKSKICCLYFHLRKGTAIIFYVGIGDERRPYSKSGRNKDWHKEVDEFGYDVIIKHRNLIRKNVFSLEIAWIKKIGRRDKGLGTLVNHSDGGDSLPILSELKEKIRIEKCRNFWKWKGIRIFVTKNVCKSTDRSKNYCRFNARRAQ